MQQVEELEVQKRERTSTSLGVKHTSQEQWKTYFQFAVLVFASIGLSKPSNFIWRPLRRCGQCSKIKPTHWLLKRLGHKFDASKVAAAADDERY